MIFTKEVSITLVSVSVGDSVQCKRCFDTGIWLTPAHKVEVCPAVQLGNPHPEPNEASLKLRRAANRLFDRGDVVASQVFELAQILTKFHSEKPCPRRALMNHFFGDTWLTKPDQMRKLHYWIEELRKSWLLPIGGRKSAFSGYWIITDLEDFKEWIKAVMSAPITQLSTVHRLAKHNFPVFAEQMELDFWKDME